MNQRKKKMSKETMDKIIETVNYLAVPTAAIGGIWGFDISVYVVAGCGAVASILEFVKLFLKK